MSYDLHFLGRPAPPDADALRAYFSRRPHYRVDTKDVAYHNESTGVYFSFDFPDLEGRSVSAAPLAFRLNYFRPHVFASEALIELGALVNAFDLGVDDPQAGGVAGDSFDPDQFLRGWTLGNAGALGIMLAIDDAEPAPVRTLPFDQVHRAWLWNCGRELYMDYLVDDGRQCFAPTVTMMERRDEPGAVFTAVLWIEAMPLALPDVDLVLAIAAPGQPPCPIAFAELRPLLDRGAEFVDDDLMGPHWLIERPGPELIARLADAGPPVALTRLGVDVVLDREDVEAARARLRV